MSKARVLILLGIGLLIGPPETRATAWDEAVLPSGAASPHDTSRVFAGSARSHLLPRWVRPAARFPVPGGPRVDHASGGGAPFIGIPVKDATLSAEPVVDGALYGADGNVLSMARSGNTLYIAGSFRSVGENSGGYVPFDTRTGQALPSFPKVAGSVYAIVPDGSGGWYIGGMFSGAGGKPRACLAQIRPDGSVSDWNPSVTDPRGPYAPPVIFAIAVDGNRVYVGGAFCSIGGQPRMGLGCVDAQTGAVLDWVADASEDGHVDALALHGDTLFVGGGFSSLGGAPRSSLAAVNALTGEVLPWRMDVFGGAYALLACADTLYVGGDFIAIAGRSQPILVAVDIPSATLLPIDFRASGISRDYVPDPRVDALAKVSDTLYVVGNFSQIGGQIRSGIAALDATSGHALTWSPDTTGPRDEGWPPLLHKSVAVSGGVVYIGGYFWSVAGTHHPYVAAWDRQTGHVLDWTPTPDDAVMALAASGDTIHLGGDFRMMGAWRHRAGLAAIDLVTGRLKPAWNPNPNGGICTAVVAAGDRVFVSGDFSIIGGEPQPRSCFAALDTTNGEVTDWNPGANDLASVFMLAGDTLYAGGMFTEVGGQPRDRLAAIDVTTGEVLPWDPSANSLVLAMARSGDTIFLGGIFTEIGGQSRLGLGAVDAFTGALAPWDPGTDNSTVDALLVAGNTLYVGGAFGLIGGQQRRALAALDLWTGVATPWRPVLTSWDIVDPRVRALAMVDSVLYIGGSFASIGGQPRICLSGVDTTTGLPTDWNAGTDGLVWSLAASGNAIYAGGGFSRAGGLPCAGLAGFSIPTPPPSPPVSHLAMAITPNPARADALVRLALPTSGAVSLDVHDLQGRLVATILRDEVRTAGIHVVPIRMSGWPEGVYFCRLEAGGATATRKMVVVQ